jgi:hypothetical protein
VVSGVPQLADRDPEIGGNGHEEDLARVGLKAIWQTGFGIDLA